MRDRRRKSGPIGLLPALLILALGLAAFDFFKFTRTVTNLVTPSALQADAVVALTGGSGKRIAVGVNLVASGTGERLLVSGVHPDVKMSVLADIAGGPLETYGCCVDIGYRAETTIGNAEETAAWAAEREYSRLIIVTSDYHLPRSMLVLQSAMPDVTLIGVPVRTKIDPSEVWSNPNSFRGVLTEWAKWRVTTLG